MCINRHLLQVKRRLARQSSSRLTMSRYVVYICICARVWVVGWASASDVCIHIYSHVFSSLPADGLQKRGVSLDCLFSLPIYLPSQGRIQSPLMVFLSSFPPSDNHLPRGRSGGGGGAGRKGSGVCQQGMMTKRSRMCVSIYGRETTRERGLLLRKMECSFMTMYCMYVYMENLEKPSIA